MIEKTPKPKEHRPMAGDLANSDTDFEKQALDRMLDEGGREPVVENANAVQEREATPVHARQAPQDSQEVGQEVRRQGEEGPKEVACKRCLHPIESHHSDSAGATDYCHDYVNDKEPCKCQSFLRRPEVR